MSASGAIPQKPCSEDGGWAGQDHVGRAPNPVPKPDIREHCPRTRTGLSFSDRWSLLMTAAQAGDDASYNLLLTEVNRWLLQYFGRRLPREIAEERCQEALLAIHLKKESYDASRPFGPWLATIAKHKWADHLRRQYRDAKLLDERDFETEDHQRSALSKIVITRLLDDLTPAQACAIRLVKLSEASVEQAAAMTGQSQSLVKVNVHRGLKKIAQQLNSLGPENMFGGSAAV